MNYRKLYYPVRILAILSFVAIAIEYWATGVMGLALLLAPYLALYFLSNEDSYGESKLAIIRIIPALVTFLFVPWLLFSIESDAQASIGLMFGVMIQLSLISLAELIIIFFLKGKSRI